MPADQTAAVLQYARHHNLVADCDFDQLNAHLIGSCIPDFILEGSAPSVLLPSVCLKDERLTISKAALKLLSNATNLDKGDLIPSTVAVTNNYYYNSSREIRCVPTTGYNLKPLLEQQESRPLCFVDVPDLISRESLKPRCSSLGFSVPPKLLPKLSLSAVSKVPETRIGNSTTVPKEVFELLSPVVKLRGNSETAAGEYLKSEPKMSDLGQDKMHSTHRTPAPAHTDVPVAKYPTEVPSADIDGTADRSYRFAQDFKENEPRLMTGQAGKKVTGYPETLRSASQAAVSSVGDQNTEELAVKKVMPNNYGWDSFHSAKDVYLKVADRSVSSSHPDLLSSQPPPSPPSEVSDRHQAQNQRNSAIQHFQTCVSGVPQPKYHNIAPGSLESIPPAHQTLEEPVTPAKALKALLKTRKRQIVACDSRDDRMQFGLLPICHDEPLPQVEEIW